MAPKLPAGGSRSNPKLWLAAVVATSVVTIGYQIYQLYSQEDERIRERSGKVSEAIEGSVAKKYGNKSIALTLSHSILNLKLASTQRDSHQQRKYDFYLTSQFAGGRRDV